MNPQILDGKICSAEVRRELAVEVRECLRPPSLGIILVGNDKPSELYVKHKRSAAIEVGIEARVINCDANINTADLLHVVERCNYAPNFQIFTEIITVVDHITLTGHADSPGGHHPLFNCSPEMSVRQINVRYRKK